MVGYISGNIEDTYVFSEKTEPILNKKKVLAFSMATVIFKSIQNSFSLIAASAVFIENCKKMFCVKMSRGNFVVDSIQNSQYAFARSQVPKKWL